MQQLLLQKINNFDKTGSFKAEIDRTMVLLKQFRTKYPYTEKPNLIDHLMGNEIFTDSGEVGDFFLWIEYHLKPLGHLYLYSNVYRNIRNQLNDFKDLLFVVVDQNKSISEKVDASWDDISGMGGDKHIAKKTIFCFNYERKKILPIFKTNDLEYFYRKISEAQLFPNRYSRMSMGEKYEFLNFELVTIKEGIPETKCWDLAYFSRFLYEMFPPPRELGTYQNTEEREKKKENQRQQKTYSEFIEVLNQLRREEKISASERRDYDQEWRENPEKRELILNDLNKRIQ